jgi:hypothetical protein
MRNLHRLPGLAPSSRARDARGLFFLSLRDCSTSGMEFGEARQKETRTHAS